MSLDAAVDELEHYTGNVWTHIISLHREDAERLGYNHAEAWRTLLRTHRNDIAAAMKIPPEDFRWYAAFHDEGNHPHVHMMAWSAKPNQAYLSKDGIRQIKSTLTNQIFRQELLHVYEQKSKSRDELVAEARKAMLELAKAMREITCIHPEAEQMIRALTLSHLTVIYIKQSLGRLSALCGCVVAATGSSCGITYLMGGGYEAVSFAVKNMIANLTGMMCDGAKPSCSLKLMTGVSTAVLSAMLAMENHSVSSVEGIIDDDVDKSIRNLTLIGRDGMNETDHLILKIMTSK